MGSFMWRGVTYRHAGWDLTAKGKEGKVKKGCPE